MTRLRIVIGSALVAALIGGGAAVSAQGPGPRGPHGHGPRGFGPRAGLALEGVDLTDAQRQQIRQLREQHRDQTRSLVDRIHKAHEAQRQALATMPFDEARIRAAMQELGEAQTELAVQNARLQSEIYALLTPQQQEQIQKRRAERQARMEQRRERMQERVQQRRERMQQE